MIPASRGRKPAVAAEDLLVNPFSAHANGRLDLLTPAAHGWRRPR